jgi:hypothetical protein
MKDLNHARWLFQKKYHELSSEYYMSPATMNLNELNGFNWLRKTDVDDHADIVKINEVPVHFKLLVDAPYKK